MNYNNNTIKGKNKTKVKKILILDKLECDSALEKSDININNLNSLNSLYSIKKNSINYSIETLNLSFRKKVNLNFENINENLENKYIKILNDQNNKDECFKNILKNKEILIYEQKKKLEDYSNTINNLEIELDEKNNINKNLQKKICKLNSDLLLHSKNKNISELHNNKKKKKTKKKKDKNLKDDFKSIKFTKSLYLKELSKKTKDSKNNNGKLLFSITPKNKIQNFFYSNNAKSLTNSDFIKNINILNKNKNKVKLNDGIYNKTSSNSNNVKKLKIIKNKKKFCFNNKSNPSNLENFRNKYNDTYYIKSNNVFKNNKINKLEKNYQSGSYLKNNKDDNNSNFHCKKKIKIK